MLLFFIRSIISTSRTKLFLMRVVKNKSGINDDAIINGSMIVHCLCSWSSVSVHDECVCLQRFLPVEVAGGGSVVLGYRAAGERHLPQILRLLRSIRSALHLQIPDCNTRPHPAICGKNQPGVSSLFLCSLMQTGEPQLPSLWWMSISLLYIKQRL